VYPEAYYVAPPHVTAAENPGRKRKKYVCILRSRLRWPPSVTAAENPGGKRKKNMYIYLEADYVGPPHVTAAENPGTGVHLSIEP
jgi:hypothetical protein